MCKAASEGGKRCHGHAMEAYTKAKANLQGPQRRAARGTQPLGLGPSPSAEMSEYHWACVDLAVTEPGTRFLVEEHLTSTYSARTIDADHLVDVVRSGHQLRDHFAATAALGVSDRFEAQQATAKVRDRARKVVAELKRAAPVTVGAPVASAAAVGALANPTPVMLGAAGLATIGTAVGEYWHSRRLAPRDKRTAADHRRYQWAYEQTQVGGPRGEAVKRAGQEVLTHLDAIAAAGAHDPESVQWARSQVYKKMGIEDPAVVEARRQRWEAEERRQREYEQWRAENPEAARAQDEQRQREAEARREREAERQRQAKAEREAQRKRSGGRGSSGYGSGYSLAYSVAASGGYDSGGYDSGSSDSGGSYD